MLFRSRLGVRRRPARIDRPKTGWEALTEAESMVAKLAAGGRTNREIADLRSSASFRVGHSVLNPVRRARDLGESLRR